MASRRLSTVARQALTRLVQQSALALGLAAASLALLAPLKLLVQALASLAAAQAWPIGDASLLVALVALNAIGIEESVVRMMHGRVRLWLLWGGLVIQLAMWAAVFGAVIALRLERSTAATVIPLSMLVYALTSPLACVLRPGQRWDVRKHRTLRELKLTGTRLSSLIAALLVILYVQVTVFTRLEPAIEFAVMGLAVPLTQAAFTAILATLMRRQELAVRKAAERRRLERQAVVPAKPDEQAPPAAQPPPAGASGASGGSHASLMMVLVAKVMYTLGALSTLALAETQRTFYLSLASMLVIEVAQTAMYVKARRMVTRVVPESSEAAFALNDAHQLQVLLYKELGEKTGAVLALGVLALDKALGRDVSAEQAVSASLLTQRGLAIVAQQLTGDVAKDLVARALGLKPKADAAVERVVLPLPSVFVAVLTSLNAGLLVKTGLALGKFSS